MRQWGEGLRKLRVEELRVESKWRFASPPQDGYPNERRSLEDTEFEQTALYNKAEEILNQMEVMLKSKDF